MRKVYVLIIAIFSFYLCYSQSSLTGPYLQNFNTLATSGTSTSLPSGWEISETGTNANTTYSANNGSANTGDSYSYGTGTSAERALGSLQSGTLAPKFGFYFTNNTGAVITSLVITYTGEQWRLGATGRTDQLDFQYSYDATSVGTGNWSDQNSLDFLTPVITGTVGGLDGDVSPNRANINGTISGLNIPVGSNFAIRWVDLDISGSEDGLAIDEISITPSSTPPSTDHFRSVSSGPWNLLSTWESSSDNTNWNPAISIPTSAANSIKIRNGHTVTISASASADQLEIQTGGTLVNAVTAGNIFTLANGSGDDLIIQSGARYQVTTTEAFTAQISIEAGLIIRVTSGGMIEIGNGGSVGSNVTSYATISTSFIWEDGSIFQWNSTGFPGMQAIFFPDVAASVIPIFRFNRSLTNLGGVNPTTINGRLESDYDLAFNGDGVKTIRNGIIANAVVTGSPTAKIVINGTTALLGGSGSLFAPQGLEVGNGTATVVDLTSNFRIDGNVTLYQANSIIQLNEYNLKVVGDISLTQKTSFIRTNDIGRLTMTVSSGCPGGCKLFPVGKSTINPMLIYGLPSSDISVRVVEPITPPIYNENAAVLRTWYISSATVPVSLLASFGYSYPSDTGPLYFNTGPVQVGVNVNGVWNIVQSGLTPSPFFAVPGTFIVSPSVSLNYFNVPGNEFSFVVANNGAILTLDCIISARSHRSNGHGIISWEVNSCNEVSSFVVERSLNGGAYLSIGTVRPGLTLAYQFIDPSPGRGLNAYRIRVNGVTGDHKFSNIVTVFNDTRGISVTLAPNPVKDECKITIYSALAGTAEFRVLNAAGQLVRQWNNAIVAGTTEYRLNLSGLSRGIYSLHVKSSAGELLKQIIKE